MCGLRLSRFFSIHRFRQVSRASSRHPSESQEQSKQYLDHHKFRSKTFGTMPTTLKEQAWQSDLVLPDDTAEWNENDWPPLAGRGHASVVLDHPDKDNNNNNNNNNNNKRQTVVVMGGIQQRRGYVNSILVLNLAEYNKQWREGPPMNKARYGHAAVVCNGGVYVMGGDQRVGESLDCIERIDVSELLQSCSTSSITHESHWATLTFRLSTGRWGCGAVAVHNRYIVVVGGYSNRSLSSVDIIDTRNHTVIAGPSMTVPRSICSSAVIGHRIFVVGGQNGDDEHASVEYLDFAEERKDDALTTAISFSPTWITHSELVLSNARISFAMVAVGSCLVVVGGSRNSTVEVVDTHRKHVWNLPPFLNHRSDCSMVTVTNQVAVIGGSSNPACATLPLVDKNSWCFRQLCKHPRIEWYHCQERSGNGDVNVTSRTISTSTLKRLRTNT